MYLENVNCPNDIKNIEVNNLQVLADEVRQAIINRISKIGGHKGPNLGVVELTVALHYVFDSPKDKIIFDVSHQCYAHKILTGRKDAFLDDDKLGSVTGFTNPLESVHDHLILGHTSTSISNTLGIAKSRDLKNEDKNVIAVIGDGSLGGGMALEGLNSLADYNHNFILVVNDNDHSIAENHGGLYKSLKELRESKGTSHLNPFKALGLEYIYIDDGHDIPNMVKIFNQVKDIDHPVVIHVHTIKGKGLWYAEANMEAYHSGGPFDVKTGKAYGPTGYYDTTTINNSLMKLIDEDSSSLVINAGTPSSMGFVGENRTKLASEGRFVDVGIAEQNAVGIAAGAAQNGSTVVVGTFASFLQRSYDQIYHDICVNNLPVVILALGAGAYGMMGNTHSDMCDIPFYSHIPNLVYLAPSNYEEYLKMFEYATRQKEHPIAIRVPFNLSFSGCEDNTDYSLLGNKVIQDGCNVAIISVGTMVNLAKEVASKVKGELGFDITIINPLFLNDIDSELLDSLSINHKTIITLEDGQVDGGYGQRVSSFFGSYDVDVYNLGLNKEFYSEKTPQEILEKNDLTVEEIFNLIKIKM